MWKAAQAKHAASGNDPSDFESKRVPEWIRSKAAKTFIAHVQLMVGNTHVLRAASGRTGSTLAHWQIALAYAKYLSPEFQRCCPFDNTFPDPRLSLGGSKGISITEIPRSLARFGAAIGCRKEPTARCLRASDQFRETGIPFLHCCSMR